MHIFTPLLILNHNLNPNLNPNLTLTLSRSFVTRYLIIDTGYHLFIIHNLPFKFYLSLVIESFHVMINLIKYWIMMQGDEQSI